jgi:transcriptional regulator with XRE-family HTH domain
MESDTGLFFRHLSGMKTKLQTIREDRGETRFLVAKETGVPYSTLTRLEERASDNINLAHLKTLADYYGQPLDVRHLLGV